MEAAVLTIIVPVFNEEACLLKFKEEMADKCLGLLERYAPNIDKDKVFQTYISTPKDIANKFLDMKEGSIKQGAYTPLQMGYVRPNEDCSHNRTPVKNLWLVGDSTHPGEGTAGVSYSALTAVRQIEALSHHR